MDLNSIDTFIQVIACAVSIVACVYTVKTYRKSHDILDVIEKERKMKWNKDELKKLFGLLSIEYIERFFACPDIIRDELWKGLHAIDLNEFLFDGAEKEIVLKFVQELDSFCDMRYERTPSNHWKFKSIPDDKPYNDERERLELKKLFIKAKKLRPQYDMVKKLLLKYHVNIAETNAMARDFYHKKLEEENELKNV